MHLKMYTKTIIAHPLKNFKKCLCTSSEEKTIQMEFVYKYSKKFSNVKGHYISKSTCKTHNKQEQQMTSQLTFKMVIIFLIKTS